MAPDGVKADGRGFGIASKDKQTVQPSSLPVRIWRSIFRGPIVPRTDRERKWVVFNTLVLHLRPVRVPKKTLQYTHTFGLGGSSMVLVSLLMATGVLMMFAYAPSPDGAYDSIVSMQEEILFGRLVRGVHYWSANLLIITVFFHLLRVFLTGGFHGLRQFNWIIGLCLLLCVLVSNFTGYLLPWDQLSYWAVTICTGMVGYVPAAGSWLQHVVRGGSDVGQATIINFYALHTTVVPVLLIILMAWHFWRVRKAGGVVIPRPPDGEREPRPEYVLFLPNLLFREAVMALVLVALVLVLALVFEAPLGSPANAGMSPNPAKAPWYFMGFQELLLHFHPVFAVFVIPLTAALALLLVPYLRYGNDLGGAWFFSLKGRRMGAVAGVTALVVIPLWIVLDEYILDATSWLPGVPPAIRSGLLPFTFVMAALVVFYASVKKRFSASSNEAVQTLFILLMASFIIATVTGVWFRGPGMALAWPWNG